MEKIALSDIIQVIKGEQVGNNNSLDRYVEEINTDSRKVTANGAFFAIVGERVDGHDYINQASSNGAIVAVISKEQQQYNDDIVYILVDDVIESLKLLATWYREKFSLPIVAVTGSVGKTTTKEMIASVLETKYKVLKTKGNLNSEIGVPLTIFGLNKSYDIAVIEMGMDHLGQIYNISKIAKPDTAVITNIGVAHLEFLKTRDNILKAKTEVFQNMDIKNGVAILNIDDDKLSTIQNNMQKIWYGYNNNANICALDTIVDYNEGKIITNIKIDGKVFKIAIPGISKHLVYSALSAIAVGLRYNIPVEKIIKGVENYKAIDMRMNIQKLNNNILLIDDTYNANPVSMKSLIDTIAMSGRKENTIIMGDMFELGEETLKGHKEVIEYAVAKGVTNIIVIGNYMKEALDSLEREAKNKIVYYESKEKLYEGLNEYIKNDSLIAIKASRGMKFEDISKKIIEIQ